MDGFLKAICGFSDTSIFVILGLRFILHLIFLKLWFDMMALLEMQQSLQTNNEQLADRIHITENQK